MTPVRLEPVAPRSRVKHSDTALPELTVTAANADVIQSDIVLHSQVY